ncbi:hypothetical protein VKT23_011877 [Stygiomarasmius scandens]|uniref:DUF6534 domain-containing protein n=1 Tax=Marasmiellus scandens TaxID=2682957 RepID=A0ABR1J778_9AGAR
MRLTIETGSVTAVITLSNLILLTGFPDQTYYVAVNLIIPKAYANTLLVILNSRFRIIGGRGGEDLANITSIDLTLHPRVPGNRRSLTSSGMSVGLERMNSGLQILDRKSTFTEVLPPGEAICASGPDSSSRTAIQISIHNEIVTDVAADDEILKSQYSQGTTVD